MTIEARPKAQKRNIENNEENKYNYYYTDLNWNEKIDLNKETTYVWLLNGDGKITMGIEQYTQDKLTDSTRRNGHPTLVSDPMNQNLSTAFLGGELLYNQEKGCWNINAKSNAWGLVRSLNEDEITHIMSVASANIKYHTGENIRILPSRNPEPKEVSTHYDDIVKYIKSNTSKDQPSDYDHNTQEWLTNKKDYEAKMEITNQKITDPISDYLSSKSTDSSCEKI